MRQSISLRAHIHNQQGIALVSSLLITLLLSLVIIALAYRAQMFSVGTRENVVKSQNIYTTDVGLNQARFFLLDKACIPPNWACIPNMATNTFTNMSSLLRTTFNVATPPITLSGQTFTYAPSGSLTGASNDGYTYNVYAKKTAMPNVINVVTVAQRTGSPAKTVVDAGILFVNTDGYAEGGGDDANTGTSSGNTGGNLGLQ